MVTNAALALFLDFVLFHPATDRSYANIYRLADM